METRSRAGQKVIKLGHRRSLTDLPGRDRVRQDREPRDPADRESGSPAWLAAAAEPPV
jgi:hypothetical protein